jgi:threonine/homoserine/homoserine lactone efflux protein
LTADLVLIGLVITLDPVPLTAFLLVLASERGVRKGAAFVLGWLLSLAIVIALTVLATGNKPPEPKTAPSTAVLAVKIAIGAALLLVALRQRRRMGRPKKPKKTPKWQARIDKMSPWYAVVIAAIVQPWPLVAAGTAIVVEAKLSSAATYIALILLCLIATSSVLIIEIPRGLPARSVRRTPRPPKDLDPQPHGSGHRHRVCLARYLAHRKEQLRARCVIT